MSNKETVLCTCPKCKQNGIGKYVHPTTKWRHTKKNKKRKLELYELTDDDDVEFNRLYLNFLKN